MYSLYLRIKENADLNGISGKELGTLLGLKKSPLTDWKNEKSCPTIEQIIKLCDIFAVSADYLLFGKQSDNNSISSPEQDLLCYFRNMDFNDQEELMIIAEMKYRKQIKRNEELSSTSEDEKLA